MSTYPFLSNEWVEAAKQVRDEYIGQIAPPPVAIQMNVVVTETPFETDTIEAYVDTSAGQLILELGALDAPELTVRVDYVTAKAIFVQQNQAAALEAFMTGRLVVEGDLSKMLALQGQTVDPLASEIATRINDLTES